MCNSNQYKYTCPRCLMKTCSLGCSKEHKKVINCDGIKPHISNQKFKMSEFNIGTLKKDLTFIEEGFTVTNASKKKTFDL